MKTLGYYNGVIDEADKLQIPFSDRACFFGDGVYDATFTLNYKPLALGRHIERFFKSAKLLNLNLDISAQQLKDTILSLIPRLSCDELLIYWQATRGTEVRSHSFGGDMKANLWILIKPQKLFDPRVKFRVITKPDNRFSLCNIKTLNLVPNVLAFNEAESKKCDEVIFVRNGLITECSHSNVHILKDGCFFTPPANEHILAGVTRAITMEACKSLGIPVFETPFNLQNLMEADEIIITSAGKLVVSVCEIDQKPVGGKAQRVLECIQDEVRRMILTME
jgi:D-alanine transaminase